MDYAQFKQEKERGAAFAIASRLLRRGLITEVEYQKLTVTLHLKYRPTISPSQSITGDPIPRKENGRNNHRKEFQSKHS